MITHLSNEQKKQLTDYLRDFVTDKRQNTLLSVLQQRTRHVTVVLENLYQSHNASAVLRSCECFGVQDIHIIEKDFAFDLNPEIVMGATKWVSVHRTKIDQQSLSQTLKNIKNKGYQLVATTLHDDSMPIQNLDVAKPLALCFGTEEEGLSDEIYEHVDACVQIPMFGFTQSFNVSVSVALCLYEVINRLHASGVDWHVTEQEQLDLFLDWMIKSARNGEKLVGRWMKNGDSG